LIPEREIIMKIELLPVATITPYERNARKIPPEAVRKVSASIQEYGWRQPIVVDRDRVVICGHTRLLAAQQLRLERVPVHVAEGSASKRVPPDG
jgi:ParB-like chromosome segregation protein Spo0J